MSQYCQSKQTVFAGEKMEGLRVLILTGPNGGHGVPSRSCKHLDACVACFLRLLHEPWKKGCLWCSEDRTVLSLRDGVPSTWDILLSEQHISVAKWVRVNEL